MPKYRDTLANGTKLFGTMAYCCHCAGDCDTACVPETCNCACHKNLRKPNCFCQVGELQCCDGCDCKCHVAEWKAYIKLEDAKRKASDKYYAAKEKTRLVKEGVKEWEKEVFTFLQSAKNDFARDRFYSIWFLYNSLKTNRLNVPKETGTEFFERVSHTPWGKEQS